MRFSATSALLALPVLAAAAEDGGLFGQYRAQFQNLLGSLGVAQPEAVVAVPASTSADVKAPVDASAPPTQLSLNNWKDTLYASVQPEATTPEEWWVLVTGGNKTCFGHCGVIDAAFTASLPKIRAASSSPHVGVINCDDQPVLCNSWSVSPGYLYVFEMLPKPAATDIYVKRLNMTTTTPETFGELATTQSHDAFQLLSGNFHPLDGSFAKNGLALAIGYVLWFFNVVPNWLFMVGVSFASRTMMNRRMPGAPGAPGAAGRPAGAR